MAASSVSSIAPAAAALRCAVQDQIEIERLRRLHRAKARARRRRDDRAIGVDFLDGVGHGDAGNGGAMRARGGDRPPDQRFAGKNPGRIMDQDNAGAVGFERLEPGAHALLPRRAAERRSLSRPAAEASRAATLAS